MANAVLVDGRRCGRVPVDDRGLNYGDGVFRTLRVHAGRPDAWAVHMARLTHDCERLMLDMPAVDTLASEAAQLFADGGDGVLKIMITRGSGGRGYTPPERASRRILSAHALPPHAHEMPASLDLARSPVILAAQPMLAGVKHLNRLEQVMARAACARAGATDAFMCDEAGRAIATTMRNLLFYSRRDGWFTPALTHTGIAGAMRQRLMSGLAEAGCPVRERDVAADELAAMQAVIACNSVGGVAAVRSIDGHWPAESESAAAHCRKLVESV